MKTPMGLNLALLFWVLVFDGGISYNFLWKLLHGCFVFQHLSIFLILTWSLTTISFQSCTQSFCVLDFFLIWKILTIFHYFLSSTIRQQLTNTEDIRRLRKKAPCTRTEILTIQRQSLDEEIFSEPVLIGECISLNLKHACLLWLIYLLFYKQWGFIFCLIMSWPPLVLIADLTLLLTLETTFYVSLIKVEYPQ